MKPIAVQKIERKGRGIIATQDIPKGTLLEAAPVGVVSSEDRMRIHQTEVFKYYFVQQLEYDQSKNVNGYLVFGLASLCNHSEIPNARVDWIEDEIGVWSHLIAQKAINKNEEVTLFYTNISEYTQTKKFVE